jgi:hypothetical protein
MKRIYWFGLILFVIALLIEIIPPTLLPIMTGHPEALFFGDQLIFGFYAFLPAYLDNVINILLMPLLIVLGAILGGFLLTPVYLWVHRLLYGRSRFYGFIEGRMSPSIGRWLRRGILPTLFSVYVYMTLASFIVENPQLGILNMLLDPFIISIEPVLTLKHLLWGFTGLIGSFVTIFLVAPTWFLDDAGLLTSNVELTQTLQVKSQDLPSISGVGAWLARLLKGYAGISVIILYAIEFQKAIALSLYIISVSPVPELEIPHLIMSFVMFPLFPILLLLWSLPALMLLDHIFESRQRYVHNLGRSMGITTFFQSEEPSEQ